MYDLMLELSHAILKNGLSLSALGTAVYVLLKHRKVKRRLRRLIPWLLQDDGDMNQYVANQTRIEAKIDVLARHMGVEEWNLPPPISNQGRSLRRFCSLLHKAFQWGSQSRRKTKMRNYLKKLGSRKFQTYLLMTVVNLLTAYLTWSGEIDVSAKIEGWMPLINIIVQLVVTAVYQWVEGKVDKAKIQSPEFTSPENYYR